MTVAEWMSIGGWWAALLSVIAAGHLFFTKPRHTDEDNRDRQHTASIMIMLGWIPLGAILAFAQGLWAGPANEPRGPSYSEMASAIESGDQAAIERLQSEIAEARQWYEDRAAAAEARHAVYDMP